MFPRRYSVTFGLKSTLVNILLKTVDVTTDVISVHETSWKISVRSDWQSDTNHQPISLFSFCL